MAYSVSQVDTKEDKSESHLWMVKWDGSAGIELTFGKEGGASPRFARTANRSASSRRGPGRPRASRCG